MDISRVMWVCSYVPCARFLESVMFWPSLSNYGWLRAWLTRYITWLTRYSTWLTRCVAVCGVFSHLSMPVVGFMLGWLGMSQPVKFLAVSRWPWLASCLADWVCRSLRSFWLSLSDGGWFEAWLATGTAVWQVSAHPPGTRTRSCQRTTSVSTGRATSSCWRRRSWKQSWPTAWRWVEPREGLKTELTNSVAVSRTQGRSDLLGAGDSRNVVMGDVFSVYMCFFLSSLTIMG